MSSIIITTQDILNHRALRRASGIKGCKDGSDAPLTSLHGISWRPLDSMNPSCFCFDCRDEYDPDGKIDLQLYNEGHAAAKFTYDNLSEKEENPQSVLFMQISQPTFTAFDEVPSPLPAPIHRNILEETPTERLHKDLVLLKENLFAKLNIVLETRDREDDMAMQDIPAFRSKIQTECRVLWDKIRAIDTLLKED